jgi:hypothetical protein
MTDEEWVANMPEHHLRGYVEVEDDVEEVDDEDASADETDEDDLVGVHDDDVEADEADDDENE